MKSLIALAVATGTLVGAQALTATPAEAGRACRTYAYYPAACCQPYFGYYKTTQYWPAHRALRSGSYFRLVSYRMVKPRR